jgi:hypothetical protein
VLLALPEPKGLGGVFPFWFILHHYHLFKKPTKYRSARPSPPLPEGTLKTE